MSNEQRSLRKTAQSWLANKAMPLWLTRGLDREHGGFFENLAFDGTPIPGPKRIMVQARQIYCCRLAVEHSLFDTSIARLAAESGLHFMVEHGSQKSGAFSHSVEMDGRSRNSEPDLYAQAFALFGLANAYALFQRDEIKARAAHLIEYLRQERALPDGGFVELQNGEKRYEANPHMHLFEAAITWLEIDRDDIWKLLADDLLRLALEKFIDPGTGALCEHFEAKWKHAELFVFEPGHHFEWAWLMGRYQNVTGTSLLPTRLRLYNLAEQQGIDRQRKIVYDEVWSNGPVKAKSSRFWPQCERIKAAIQLEKETGDVKYGAAAAEAMTVLMKYLETPTPGTNYDQLLESGAFTDLPSKASSLYHIAGAMIF